ncbi:MAG: glycosyltransferase family 4 protein [Planctomycetota bacterium]|jgi:glycosyltransferase involved in cell wall biosynthesis
MPTLATPQPATRSDELPSGVGVRLAYLTTEYPKVSHTFIRREILELDRLGWDVLRLAIRGAGGAVKDRADEAEVARTFVVLEQPAARILGATAATALARPVRFARALRATLSMSRRSERGLLRHLAYLAEACLLRPLLAQRRIDHVHVHFGTNAAAVARLLRLLGGPGYSMMVHGPDEFDAPIGLSLAEKVADARFVAAISDFCSAQLRRWADPAHWDRIHVVRCTVGGAFLDEPAPIDPDGTTLLSIGRLSAQKGQLLLLEAMAGLRDEGRACRLVLAGDGELRPLIESRIDELDLADRVTITGWVDEDEVRALLRDCRALVQPSFAEGLPVVMMEALAMGRPVIATAIAGVPELVRPGESGWVVPAGNVPLLQDAMRDALAASSSRLEAMGRGGRERVLERHATGTEVARLAALLERYGRPDGGA